MNQRLAFSDTLALAERMNMPLLPGSDLGLEHLREMGDKINAGDSTFSASKLGRWLGWAQCAVVASGVATLEDMKQINLRHA